MVVHNVVIARRKENNSTTRLIAMLITMWVPMLTLAKPLSETKKKSQKKTFSISYKILQMRILYTNPSSKALWVKWYFEQRMVKKVSLEICIVSEGEYKTITQITYLQWQESLLTKAIITIANSRIQCTYGKDNMFMLRKWW